MLKLLKLEDKHKGHLLTKANFANFAMGKQYSNHPLTPNCLSYRNVNEHVSTQGPLEHTLATQGSMEHTLATQSPKELQRAQT